MASTPPPSGSTLQLQRQQQHAAQAPPNSFLDSSSIAPRSSSLPLSLSLPRMGSSQSKHTAAPSTPTSTAKSITGGGGFNLKRAFANRRKKTGEDDRETIPLSSSHAPQQQAVSSVNQRSLSTLTSSQPPAKSPLSSSLSTTSTTTTPTMRQPSHVTVNANRNSVIPLSPAITSAVAFISMLDQQEKEEATVPSSSSSTTTPLSTTPSSPTPSSASASATTPTLASTFPASTTYTSSAPSTPSQILPTPSDIEKGADNEKDAWRKSDSTMSYHTIRPTVTLVTSNVNVGSRTSSSAAASPTTSVSTSRPVSWAESFQSARTVVQGQGQGQGQTSRRVSALLVDSVEESEEENSDHEVGANDQEQWAQNGKEREREDESGSGTTSESESDVGSSLGLGWRDRDGDGDSVSSATSASGSGVVAGGSVDGHSSSKSSSLHQQLEVPAQGQGHPTGHGHGHVQSLSQGHIPVHVQPSIANGQNGNNTATGKVVLKRRSMSLSDANTYPNQYQHQYQHASSSAAGPKVISLNDSPAGKSSQTQMHLHGQKQKQPSLSISEGLPPPVPAKGTMSGPSTKGSTNTNGSGGGSSSSGNLRGRFVAWASGAGNAGSSWTATSSVAQTHEKSLPPVFAQHTSQASLASLSSSSEQAHSQTQSQMTSSQSQSQQVQSHSLPFPQHVHPHQNSHSATSHRYPQQMSRRPPPSSFGQLGVPPPTRSPAVSLTSGGLGLAKRAVEKMVSAASSSSGGAGNGRKWGLGGASDAIVSGNGTPPQPSSFVQGLFGIGYAMQRAASGSGSGRDGNTSSGSKEENRERERVAKRERKEHQQASGASTSKQNRHGQANSVSSSWSLDSSGGEDVQGGPVLGRLWRPPMVAVRLVKGGTGGGGLVFKRDLKGCVKDTGVWVVGPRQNGTEMNLRRRDKLEGVTEETFALIKELEEERTVPALVVRCAQHLLIWGVQEEGLFRVNGMPSHVNKLRAEFDAGADYDMTESSPGDLDPHAVASVFKAYLRELPEPILTQKLQRDFDAAINKENTLNTASDAAARSLSGSSTSPPTMKNGLPSGPKAGLRKPPSLSTLAMPSFHGIPPPSAALLTTLRSLIQLLPKENRDLTRTVVDLIRATSRESKKTKMPLSNLLLVFCPSLQMMPPLLKVLCENEGIWEESKDMEEDEIIDIRRMTITPEGAHAVASSDVPPPTPVKDTSAKKNEDTTSTYEGDGESVLSGSRASLDTTDTDNYHASGESGDEDEHEHEHGPDSSSLSLSAVSADLNSLEQQRKKKKRYASVDMKSRIVEKEKEMEMERLRQLRGSEVPTVYMDSRSHLSTSNSSMSSFGERRQEVVARQKQQDPTESPTGMSTPAGNQTEQQSLGKHMKRRSIAMLSLPSISPFMTPLGSPAHSSNSSSNNSSSAAFPIVGADKETLVGQQRTLRAKKPSLKLLFSKMGSGGGGLSNASVAGRTISGPILQSSTDEEDEEEYGQSTISTPISAVTAPQSSIPGPNSSPRLNHSSLTVEIEAENGRTRSASTASSYLPPVLDTPIEDGSLGALDGVLGGFAVIPPTAAELIMSAPATLKSQIIASPITPPSTAGPTRRPVMGRGAHKKQSSTATTKGTPNVHPLPSSHKQTLHTTQSKESLASVSSSASSTSVLSSASSASFASSQHLSLLADEDEEETVEDWTQSVLLAAADVATLNFDATDSWIGIGPKGASTGTVEEDGQGKDIKS